MAALVPPSAASIRYGEFVESIYDTINPNDGKFLWFPLYGKSKLFAMANLAPPAILGHAYRITHYIYCTVMGVPMLDVETGTVWIGYIAESTEEESQRLGRHDIVVVIRGSKGTGEWIKDFSYAFADFPFAAPGAQVHGGFLSIYTSRDPTLNFGAESMREQIFNELHAILRSHGAAEARGTRTLPVGITITGHSMGAALATLVACDMACNLVPKFANVTASLITFGSPKVGNDQFKIIIEKHTAFIWRYRSFADPVPFVPPSLLGPFVHVGTELVLDWQPSPYVSISIPSWLPFSMKGHNLELYMHVMAAENVYTSTQLEDLLGGFPLGGAGATYVIEAISQMSAWDDGDHDLLKQELEGVKDCLKEDSSEMVAYLKEVNYIAVSRSKDVTRRLKNVAPRLHGAQAESPFDRRDYSLLNKSANILKAEYCVPTEWLVHPNKDMIWDSSSHDWLPRVERPYDIPTPDNPEYN